MPDGPVNQPVAVGLNQRLIPASTTVLQPGSRYFRLVDAFAQLDQSQAVVALQNQVGALQTDVATLQGQIVTLQGQVATLQGQVSTLQSQVQGLIAFQATFNYLQAEVSTGAIFLDQRTIYKRSFVISAALNTAITVFTYAHTIANINYVVNIQAMAAINAGQQLPITFVNMAQAPSLGTGLSCWADTTNIYIAVGTSTFPNYLTLVTLWYTATDR